MPALVAAIAASAAGWLSDAAIRPVAGLAVSVVMSLVLSSLAFVFVKRYFEALRDGR